MKPNDETVKIERGIPIPDSQSGARTPRWPLWDMEIGDSFQFDPADRPRVACSANYYRKRYNKKFSIRVTQGVGRCWRIA